MDIMFFDFSEFSHLVRIFAPGKKRKMIIVNMKNHNLVILGNEAVFLPVLILKYIPPGATLGHSRPLY